jgi:hypothetical protein
VSQNDDPVPPGLLLSLDEAFRVLEALEDALLGGMGRLKLHRDCRMKLRQ